MENSSFIYKNISLLIAQPTSALLISYSRYSAKLHSGELAGIFYMAFHPGPEKSACGSISLCFLRSQGREMNSEKWRKAERQDRRRKVSAWECSMHQSGMSSSGTLRCLWGCGALWLLQGHVAGLMVRYQTREHLG